MIIEIYTDGACDKNPGGNGGWAAVLVVDGAYKGDWSGFEFETTNQRMELTAAINGIKETIDWYVNNTDWIEDIKSGEYKNSYSKSLSLRK